MDQSGGWGVNPAGIFRNFIIFIQRIGWVGHFLSFMFLFSSSKKGLA
jgi:hypothetical protein